MPKYLQLMFLCFVLFFLSPFPSVNPKLFNLPLLPAKEALTHRKIEEGRRIQRIQHQETYLQVMKHLNKIFIEVQEKKKLAVVRKKEFFTNDVFDQEKWNEWLATIEIRIHEDREMLRRVKKETIGNLHYPITHTNVEKFCTTVLTVSKKFTNEVFQCYDLPLKFVVEEEEFGRIVKNIQRIHSKVAIEMEMHSIRKVFGFLPPKVMR